MLRVGFAGTQWQNTLYTSVDASRSMLALITPEYLESAVCGEEICLALAKHFAKVLELLFMC